MDITTKIGRCILEYPVMNASGPKCSTKEELIDLAFSDSSAILSESCTINECEGNPKPRYYDNSYLSINSMGLPNKGYKYYIDIINKLSSNNVKPYIISIAGMCLDDNIIIINAIHDKLKKNIDWNVGIEINLSCPNIINKGQLAYDFENMDLYLKKLFQNTNINLLKMVGIKLPPYFEVHHFKIVANIIKKYPIDFITTINSIGNGLVIDVDNEKPRILPKQGLGGLGGSIVKPTGLSNVFNFAKEFLNTNVQIIGVGGVEKGSDIFEYILAGASAVQVGTHYYKEGVKCFYDLIQEFIELLEKKKYNSINEFRGKLLNF